MPEAQAPSLRLGCEAAGAVVQLWPGPVSTPLLSVLLAPLTEAGVAAVGSARAASPAALLLLDASDVLWTPAVVSAGTIAGADLVVASAAPGLAGVAGVGVVIACSDRGRHYLPALPPFASPALAASLAAACAHGRSGLGTS